MTDAYSDTYSDFYSSVTATSSAYTVEIDWDKDGDYSDTGEDATARVRRGVSVEYGRDQSTALAPTISGRGAFTLDNSSGDYNSLNTASPLYGLIKPARPVRITLNSDSTGTPSTGLLPADDLLPDTSLLPEEAVPASDYTVFIGHTDDSPFQPDFNNKTVTVSLVDSLADFRGQNISTPVYRGIRTGDAIGYVLDACGWTGPRDLDPGATYIPYWWADNEDAFTALDKILRSEGPPAMLTVGAGGGIIFWDRHHRLINNASKASQDVWYDSAGDEPTMARDFVYDEAWRNIINSGTVSVDVRTGRQPEVVWTADGAISLSAGEQKLITVSGSDPFLNAEAPVAGTDYIQLSGTVTASLLRTSGAATTIVLTAVGSAAVITGLQLRAQPISAAYTVQVSAADTTSIDDFGARSFPNDLPWCNPYDAEAVLSTTVALRAQPLPIVSAQFMLVNDERRAAIAARDLSDRVTVTANVAQLNRDFYIESIRHDMASPFEHSVTFGLEATPLEISPMLRFDDAAAGFDVGKFGNGLDSHSTLFQFDQLGQGFSEGIFAT